MTYIKLITQDSRDNSSIIDCVYQFNQCKPEDFDLAGSVSEFKKRQDEFEHDWIARLVFDVLADQVQHADTEMNLLGKLGLLLRFLRPEICR